MARIILNVRSGRSPAGLPARGRNSVFGIVGATTHMPAGGATYTVPAIGDVFLISSEAEAVRGGLYSEGTLGQALAAIEAHGDWQIVGVRHDDGTTLSVTDALEMLEDAEEEVGVRPNRITTADQAHTESGAGVVDNTLANPVVTKMNEVCNDLDAVGYPSGPGTNVSDFIGWLGINTNDRLFGCAPYATLAGQATAMGMGPVWAAAQAAKQRDHGFWSNPHGADVNGVNHLSFPVRFNPLSATSQSSLITAANGVSVFRRNGYHLLGGDLMHDPASTEVLQQGTARFVLDDLQVHLANAGERALEGNVGPDLFDIAGNIIRNRLAFLAGVRAVNSGTVTLDPVLNTPAANAAGDVFFLIDTDVVKNVRNVHMTTYVS